MHAFFCKMADSYTDVLIVGAGPAGLMASLYLSELGVKHRIIDQLGTRALNGRADGFQVRTVEIWDSFSLAHKLDTHGNRFREWALWTPAGASDAIVRTRREPVFGEDVSRLRPGTFHQGFIEASLIEGARQRSGPAVERGMKPTSISFEPPELHQNDHSAYAVHIAVQHLHLTDLETWSVNAHTKLDASLKEDRGTIDAFGTDPENIRQTVSDASRQGTVETIHAKYVIAADGGRSWIRRQLGFHLEGANLNSVWGVIDIVPITNFPDIRKLCTILSKHGTILVIPRESGLVRLYVQLPDEDPNNLQKNRESDKLIAATQIIKMARQIFEPYEIDYTVCDWWTIYKVGHRVADHFSYKNRVFLVGDAIHTHTPLGGQGMNVSQQDSYNLAWKIAGVLHGQLNPSILSTFESERRPIAKELISIDRDLARILTARAGVEEKDVKRVYDRIRVFGSGTQIQYSPSAIVADVTQTIASRITCGVRLPNAYIYNLANGNRTAAQTLLRSTGAWCLIVLAGKVSSQAQLALVNQLGARLAILSRKFPHVSARSNGMPYMRVLLFAADKSSDFEGEDLHSVFRPFDPARGYDYNTVFSDQPAEGNDLRKIEDSLEAEGAHKLYGVDTEKGGMLLVRPDQVVAWMGGLEDVDGLEAWLDLIMGKDFKV